MGIVRYNFEVRLKLIELSLRGLNNTDIAKVLGVHPLTISRWRKKDSKLDQIMTNNRLEAMRTTLESGLLKLSSGSTLEEQTIEEAYIDENNKAIKKIKKIKEIPPSEKAIEILARKYDKELSKSGNIIEGSGALNININTSGMSLRELQDMNSSNPLGEQLVIDGELSE